MSYNNNLKNKIINVKTERIVFPGRSLCRCGDGVALFTEGLLPTETADVVVTKDKKTFREGLVKNITSVSAERIDPLCSSFGLCGGCSFQNVSYEKQIEYKYEYTSELLNFTGAEIPKILPNPQIWHYRNKMEFSFFKVPCFKCLNWCDLQTPSSDTRVQNRSYCKEKCGNGTVKKDVANIGLHCRGSFDRYVPALPCFIADRDFLPVAEIVKKFANENNLTVYNNKTHKGFLRHLVLRKAKNNDQLLINIVTNAVDCTPSFWTSLISELSEFSNSIYWTSNGIKSEAVLADKLTLIYGDVFITERLNVGGKSYFFNILPFSFFQTSLKGSEILYGEILNMLNPSKSDVLLDLYCGVGTIGISMAENFREVLGIEQSEQSVKNARENALVNGVYNVKFQALTAESWIRENVAGFDAIIVDPPRSGLAKNVVKFLIESKAKKIVYVSCNPSTLARDLKLIVENSKYRVKKITPVDMFPQTYHIEVAVLLEL